MAKKLLLIVILALYGLSTVFGQEKKHVQIGILAEGINTEAKKVLEMLKTEVFAVVGEDAIIEFPNELGLDNKGDLNLAKSQYQQLINSEADIILVFGITSFEALKGRAKYEKPTLIFGDAPVEFYDFDVNQTTSGIKNLSYIITTIDYREDLDRFYSIYEYKNLGIAVEKNLHDLLPFDAFVEGEFKDKPSKYRIIPFETIQDITSNIDGLDALYLSGGFLFNDEEIKSLADTLLNRKVASFTATQSNDVALGLMASNQSSKNDELIFRRIALDIESVVNGEDPANLPMYLENDKQLTVNINTAKDLGLSLRYSLMAQTTIVGDIGKVTTDVVYDLPSIISETLERNLDLQVSGKDVELTEQEVKSARSNYLPDLTAGLASIYTDPELAEVSNGSNPEFQTYTTAELEQVIYDPDASMNVRIQKDLNEAQKQLYTVDQLDATFNSANAYFNILLAKATLIINEQNLQLTKSNLKIAVENYEAGQSGKPDVLRFRSELAQNTQSLIESANSVEQSYYDLNQVLNQPIDRKIDVVDADLNEGIFERYNYDAIGEILDNPVLLNSFKKFLVEEAIENAPELKATDYNLSATERSLKRASVGRFIPTAALSGRYQYFIDRSGEGAVSLFPGIVIPESNYFVGLNMSLPVFQRNIQNINKQTAIIQKEQLNLSQDNIRLAIERNVNVSILSVINQLSNLEVSKVAASTAFESLELTQESYARGAVNIIQLIDAQTNYLEARIANATAVYSYMISVLQLERTISYFFLTHSEEENEAFTLRFSNYLLQGN